MTETLRLNRDQQQAVGEVLDEFLPQIISHEERVRELRVELAEQYAEPQTKANEVRSLVGELNRTQARLDSLVAETLLREVDLLTPDQRRLYVEIVPWGRPKQPQPGPRQDTSDPRQDRPEPRQEPPDRRSPPPDREPPPPPDRQPPPPDRQPPPPDRG